MQKYLLLATAAAVVLGCTSCTDSDQQGNGAGRSPHRTVGSLAKAPPQGARPTPSATGRAERSVGARTASAFCNLARQVGKANLGVSEGNLDPNPKKLLGQVDRLDAIAPAELKQDFDVFARFEHTVIDPASARPAAVPGDTTAALEHVSTYFAEVCGVN